MTNSREGRTNIIMPDFSIEDQYHGRIAGVDEVGRGPLAGPVVAAAVILPRDERLPVELLSELNDCRSRHWRGIGTRN